MARDGSGTAQKAVSDFVNGNVISETDMNTLVDDIIDMLTQSLSKDGQTVVTGALKFNGKELILDVNQDTSITADTDDQIDIRIAGADDFRLVANIFRALAGSQIQTDTINETTSAAGVTVDGVLLKDGQVDGRDVATDGAKLDGIESGADVTDTANVTAAGALMDSEVDADLKTFVLPANTTISTFGATLVDDASAAAAATTLGLGTGDDVAFNTVTGSIYLGGSGAANLLDDHEKGTHTISPNGNLTLNHAVSRYIKYGDMVTVWGTIGVNTVTGTNQIALSLPFTSAADPASGRARGVGVCYPIGPDTGDIGCVASVGPSSTTLNIVNINDNGANALMTNAELTAGDLLYFNIT